MEQRRTQTNGLITAARRAIAAPGRAMRVGATAVALLISGCFTPAIAGNPSSTGGEILQIESGLRQAVRTRCPHEVPVAYSNEAGAFAVFMRCPTGVRTLQNVALFVFYPEARRTADIATICPTRRWGPDLQPVDGPSNPDRLDLYDAGGGRFVYFCQEYLINYGQNDGRDDRQFLLPYVLVDARDPESINQDLRYVDAVFEGQSVDFSFEAISSGGLAAITRRVVMRSSDRESAEAEERSLIVDLETSSVVTDVAYWSELGWCDSQGGSVVPDGRDCSAHPEGFIGDTNHLWAFGVFWATRGGELRANSRAPGELEGAQGFDAVVDLGTQGRMLVDRWPAALVVSAHIFDDAHSGWLVHRQNSEGVIRLRNLQTGREVLLERRIVGTGGSRAGTIFQTAIDRTGRRLIAARRDDRYLVFDLESGRGELYHADAVNVVRGPSNSFFGIDRRNRVYTFNRRHRIQYLGTLR